VNLEDRLREGLARKAPPDGFAERVLARAARVKARPGPFAHWRRWAAIPVAASLLALAVGVEQLRERRVREEGEAARAQLLLALDITSGTLQHIQKSIQKSVQKKVRGINR
jgi:hypothetical protein